MRSIGVSGLAAMLLLGVGCASLVDMADARLNAVGKAEPEMPSKPDMHLQRLIVDLHADTLMWRRGLENKGSDPKKPLGQVDLQRLKEGNVGLQVFAMPTRVPIPSDAWISENGVALAQACGAQATG